MSLWAVGRFTLFTTSGVNHDPGWTETGEESEAQPSTNSCSSNSSWSIWELLQRRGKWHMSPASLSMKYRQDVCISNITHNEWMKPLDIRITIVAINIDFTNRVHLGESNILNYDPPSALSQQQQPISYPLHCPPGSFYAVNSWQADNTAVEEKENADPMLHWAVICRYQTERYRR